MSMRLGTRAKYTLRLMMAIGRLAEQRRPVSLGEVARHCGISRRYLEQLVVSLRHADLLRGRSGRGGGYLLSRPASEIRIGEIIEAAIGPITISECVTKADTCMQSSFCQCRLLWQLIDHRIDEVLNEYSLADLIDHRWTARAHRDLEQHGARVTGACPTAPQIANH